MIIKHSKMQQKVAQLAIVNLILAKENVTVTLLIIQKGFKWWLNMINQVNSKTYVESLGDVDGLCSNVELHRLNKKTQLNLVQDLNISLEYFFSFLMSFSIYFIFICQIRINVNITFITFHTSPKYFTKYLRKKCHRHY